MLPVQLQPFHFPDVNFDCLSALPHRAGQAIGDLADRVRRAVDEAIDSVATTAYNFTYGACWGLLDFCFVSIPVCITGSLIVEYFADPVHLEEFTAVFEEVPWEEIVVIGPIIEELLFRLLLQSLVEYTTGKLLNLFEEQGLAEQHAKQTARVVTSVVFGAVHLLNGSYYAIVQAFSAMLMGYFILSPLRESHGLEAAIGAHMMNNGLAVALEACLDSL